MITKLKYGNTNTFLLRGKAQGLLIDTDWAGTISAFYKEIKKNGVAMEDISYVLATHYHPDYMGLVSELTTLGVRLLLMDSQLGYTHFADTIFARDRRLHYRPIDESKSIMMDRKESREFLEGLGINGEVIATPSHSADSVSIILDDGNCFVGDLTPISYMTPDEGETGLLEDWKHIMRYGPKTIYYGHANEQHLQSNGYERNEWPCGEANGR